MKRGLLFVLRLPSNTERRNAHPFVRIIKSERIRRIKMRESKCLKCGNVFAVNGTGYSNSRIEQCVSNLMIHININIIKKTKIDK